MDMWFTDHPAFGFNGSTPAAAPIGPEKDYEEYKFAQRAYTVWGGTWPQWGWRLEWRWMNVV